MCANPQTARATIVYKTLAPPSFSSVRMPSYLAPLLADVCFAESVSKTRGLAERLSWISQKESFYEQD